MYCLCLLSFHMKHHRLHSHFIPFPFMFDGIKLLLRAENEPVRRKGRGCGSLLSEPERCPETPLNTHRPLHFTQVLPLRLRLCWMVAWRGGGGGRGRGRDCRDAPITLTRKGPGCGPPISSGREQEGGFRARRIRRCHRKSNGSVEKVKVY